MKNLVSNVTAGLLKILSVNSLDGFAFVRLSERKIFICLIKSLASDAFKVNKVADTCRLNGLTAAVYAAAGASHNLNESAVPFLTFSITASAFLSPLAAQTLISMPATV